jgi:DNA-binding SARP family transcriptional activator/pimeloyl-ACP methyl ester carboxylesterase
VRTAGAGNGPITEIRILGPLEVVAEDGPIDLPGGKERLLLAALVVHANMVVSTDRLIEVLWRDRPPVTAANTLQTYISHLRRALDPGRTARPRNRVLITREPGYVLAVGPDMIDAVRFEQLVGDARPIVGSAPDAAAALLRSALSLWRGEPLADFAFEPFARAEITRLTELRLAALEDRIDAELALGDHGALCGELAQLVREHPLRERLSAQLMVALYRSGRQAEALHTYADVRATLAEQLGIDPSPALGRLEAAILRQEPELDPPPTVPGAPVGRARTERERIEHARTERARTQHAPTERASEHDHEHRILFCHAADGTRIAYSVVGSGPPLVKAANWMTHLDHDLDSPLRRHWTEDIARARTLLRYDERGCGMSDWDVDRFDFDAWVDDLETVVDSAGLDRFPLLGVSQGAAVAVAFAVRHPERVSRMVLYGSYARGRRRRIEGPGAGEAALDVELARLGWGRDDPSFRQVFTSQFLPDGSRADWDELNELQRRTTSPENAARFLETFADIDITAEAPMVRCPTLIVHARDDRRVPASAARELAAMIPGGRFVLLPGRNHLLTRDEPAWPRFLGELDHFLAE